MQTTLSLRIAGVAAVAALLSACAPAGPYGTPYMSGDAQRAAVGAVGGAVVAKALDEKVSTGAILGAAAGALCDDVNVCPQ